MDQTPDQHDPDWPRYPDTVLDFAFKPRIFIDLRQLVTNESREALRQAGFGQPFAILTAFDPHGKNLSRVENERRHGDLERHLTQSGLRFAIVDCCSPDRSHCECSVAVLMRQEEALELARELEQMAFFWFDGDRFWILGAIVDSDPLMLPRSS